MKRGLIFRTAVLLTSVGLMTGAESSDQKFPTSAGTYKTMKVRANIEYEGSKYDLPPNGHPLEMAYGLLELNQERIGIADPRTVLKLRRELHHSLGDMVSFKQTYNGLEIAHSDVRVYFTPDGDLRDIDGEFHYDINLSTDYSIDSATAVEIALNDIGPLPEGWIPKIKCSGKPVIVPSSDLQLRDERKLYLVWHIGIFQIKPPPNDDSIGTGIYKTAKYGTLEHYISYSFYIDANSGEILLAGTHDGREFRRTKGSR